MLTTRAPAKINLTLHVLGRREDGYHALESLVCFAAAGDTVSLVPGPELSLTVDGPHAALAGDDADNLVLKAARLLRERFDGLKVGAFRLTKRLPVAAGLGGGSSDAAGALRILARLNALSPSDPRLAEAARLTGSDVPVCLDPRARMMRGAGEAVGPALRLPRLFCVLVNPRVPVGTPAVFRALGLARGERHAGAAHPAIGPNATASELLPLLRVARNDLEAPARALEPVIGDALALVAGTPECRLARMSGSGATVFGLYEDRETAGSAAKALRDARPAWWIQATSLR